jgi:hypothetical protein
MSVSVVERARSTGTEVAEAGAVVDPAPAAVRAAVDRTQRRRLSWAQSPDAPEGEHIVRSSLQIAAQYGWTALHEVTWASSEPMTLHVAVGPGGVVVIDERVWTEPVRVDGDVLRRGGFPCERELAALSGAMAVVAGRVPEAHRRGVFGVLCVTPRDMEPQPCAGIMVVGRLHLATLLTSMPARLSPLDVADVVRALEAPPQAAPVAAVAPAPAGAHLPTVITPAPTTGPIAPVVPIGQIPSQVTPETAQDRAAYFARQQAPSLWPRPTVPLPAGVAPGNGHWRTAVGRVTVAVLAGLLAYGHSDAITTAVGEWWGETPGVVRAAE